MSHRHEQSRAGKPGRSKTRRPSTWERRAANRQVRHVEHTVLATGEPDADERTPRPRRKPIEVEWDPFSDEAKPRRRKRYKVWRTPMWKRRSKVRQRRARAEHDGVELHLGSFLAEDAQDDAMVDTRVGATRDT